MTTHFSMPGGPTNRSMPPGTIVPVLVYPDMASAVAWLCAAFGFSERLRIGNHRCQLIFGTASIVVVQGDESAWTSGSKSTPADSIMVHVEDVDAHYVQAREHGAPIISAPADYPYGERQYTAEDLSGRRWTFSQSLADVDPRDWGGVMR